MNIITSMAMSAVLTKVIITSTIMNTITSMAD